MQTNAQGSGKPEKRAHKHAPVEMSSKRPVTRKRQAVEVKKVNYRDPRFSSLGGETSTAAFQKHYSFLADMHKTELSTLKESLKRAKTMLRSSPRDQREEREEEVQRLERAVKRAESSVDRDRREGIEGEALERIKTEEKERRKEGKGDWHMKDSAKKELLLRARHDALAESGGRFAVRKAIEKRQKKISQKEKKRIPAFSTRPSGAEEIRQDSEAEHDRVADFLPLSVDSQTQGIGAYTSNLPFDSQTELRTTTAPHEDSKLEDEAADFDIYRGGRLSPSPDPPDIDELSIAPSSSSSSSNTGRRFGALAAVVEAAITRWARAHSSASSSTSSSSSSSSYSGLTTSRTHATRHRKSRRYSSAASLHNAAHERAILARKRAREEFRVTPRELTLLLPSELVLGPASLQTSEGGPHAAETREQAKERRIIRTTSMPLILGQLDSALKKSAKWKRTQERSAIPDVSSMSMISKGKGKKGKSFGETSVSSQALSSSALSRITETPTTEKGWWLDVASPSWDDLRSIGRILRLHPLTLEDILHQDPREKLELFPGLGYYFIVFRALEGERSRERFRQFRHQGSEGITGVPTGPGDEGVIGAVNVYLVVFREGICSFHFEDISDHTEKLRNKILHLEDTLHMTSDWIAHGLLDSIVDSFFPILVAIEKEVKEVDALVLDNSQGAEVMEPSGANVRTAGNDAGEGSAESTLGSKSTVLSDSPPINEKANDVGKDEASLRPSRLSLPLTVRVSEPYFSLLHRLKHTTRKLLRKWITERERKKPVEKEQPTTSTSKTLLRMAATRRIVTSLGRLLGTKGDVIAQIRKRLLASSVEASSAGLGLGVADGGEVAMYMGDIQDHILTLQQSLTHYERMLSHSHPAYLSQLRVSQSLAKGSTDKAILLLTVVSITVLCIQVILGLFSINVGKIPHNDISGGTYTVFYIILSVSVLIGFGVVGLVRYWRMRARKKFSRQI
ncbi:hypothetical protein M0805_002310 [Coniferiporia weirii]|nr:hypothetical protein M0805_002310 [Coniferiporia weirii]